MFHGTKAAVRFQIVFLDISELQLQVLMVPLELLKQVQIDVLLVFCLF